MAEVGRQETPIFTWNPVEQMWVQERGGAAKPPPNPHDVHAIQTWFLDPDENEWIQTVLGPMGRQLAAQWRGAYRVPETAVARKPKESRKRSPLAFLVAGLVLLALIGGVALAAPSLMGAPAATPATPAPGTTGATGANPEPLPTAAPTAAPTEAPAPTAVPTEAPVATPAPTPRPPVRPAGPSVTLADGTTVYYTGPTSAARGGFLPASFTVIRANGRPGAGAFAIILDRGDPANRRVVTGTLNAAGQIALQVPTNVVAASYPLSFSYGGDTRVITTIQVR
jgi:hypothetical protein